MNVLTREQVREVDLPVFHDDQDLRLLPPMLLKVGKSYEGALTNTPPGG